MAMAKAVNDAELWLPSQFLADADILGDKVNDKISVNADLEASFGFPSEFPYEFYSFGNTASALSSPVESVAGSTETDSSGSDVDEDFFAALTRRLSQSSLYETPRLTVPTCCDRDKTEVQKTHGLARSPQSTLSGIGSWSGSSAASGERSPSTGSQVPSPPTTPFPSKNDFAWDVIYAAAGRVARLKMTSEVSKYNFQNGKFVGAPRPAIPKTQGPSVYENQSFLQVQAQQQARQQQCASVWGRQAKADWLVQQQQKMQNRVVRNVGYESLKCGRPLSQSAWPPLQVQAHNLQQVRLNGSGSRAAAAGNGGSVGRRGCGGTGVFLPRQYENPPETRKKPSSIPVLLPSKVIHGRNLKMDDLNAANQTGFPAAFSTEYDALMARRNALLVHQQRLSVRPEDSVNNHDLRLPQDWIY